MGRAAAGAGCSHHRRAGEALADERRAQDTYRAIMDRFGEVRPFINVYQAEVQHEREILFLFDRYGIAVPARQDLRTRVAVPDTLAAAFALGVESEKVTVALYDRLLSFVEEPEVRQVFGWLREVSLTHHQPAFARCAERAQGGRGRRPSAPTGSPLSDNRSALPRDAVSGRPGRSGAGAGP